MGWAERLRAIDAHLRGPEADWRDAYPGINAVTLLERAVLAKDEPRAMDALAAALAEVREVWEPETTARNLRLIREARERRRETLPWARRIGAAPGHGAKGSQETT